MVLPHAKGMEPDVVRQLRLFQQLAKHLRVRHRVPVGVHPDVAKSVQAEQDLPGADGSGGAVGGRRGGGQRPGVSGTGRLAHRDSFSQPASSDAQ
ncbi:hypothetical protein D9M72_571100 [compost metagenome]